jgi:hypothetical protein
MSENDIDLTIPNTSDDENKQVHIEQEKPTPVEQEEPVQTKSGKNATQHYPLSIPETKETELLSLPTDYASNVRDVLNELPNIDLTDNPEAREWVEVLNQGLEMLPAQEMFKDTLSEADDGNFTQKPEYNGKLLIPGAPKFEKLENSVLKGEKAVIRVLQTLGLGSLFQVPLWHTGIWVTIKPPTEAEIIELNRQLINDKIQFGRSTYGLAFANTVAYTVDRLMDFIIDHIYNTTLKTESLTGDQLKKMISCQDFPILLWGIACTIYSSGFKYQRACITNPEKCNHILEETINVTKLLWVNIESLTDYQKEHMSFRQARTRTAEQIERYKDELKVVHNSRVKLDADKDIHMTIKSPSMAEYIEGGYAWISSIVDAVEKTISSDLPSDEKEALIIRYAQASRLRQYGHWVESIEVETNITGDQETINELLNVLSSDDQIFASMMGKIKAYINHSVTALVGIPSFDCPKCSEKQEDNVYPQFTNIIPLDVQQLFFGLFTQRLIKLTDR